MEPTIRDLISYRLAMLASRNDRSGQAHLKETFGITLGAWRVLGNIAADEPVTFLALAARLLIDKGQLSRTIASLAAQGWITTTADPQDRRSLHLRLSRSGRALHDRVLVFATERNEAVMSALGPQERRSLAALLSKLETFVEIEHAALARGNARDAERAARAAVRRPSRKLSPATRSDTRPRA